MFRLGICWLCPGYFVKSIPHTMPRLETLKIEQKSRLNPDSWHLKTGSRSCFGLGLNLKVSNLKVQPDLANDGLCLEERGPAQSAHPQPYLYPCSLMSFALITIVFSPVGFENAIMFHEEPFHDCHPPGFWVCYFNQISTFLYMHNTPLKKEPCTIHLWEHDRSLV